MNTALSQLHANEVIMRPRPQKRGYGCLLTFARQAIQQNHSDIAKIYAQNAIRKKNENLNLLRLASRIDAVSSKVQTAVTMRQVTGSMANVVKGMDSAMKSMDLEKVCSERTRMSTF